ncbi:MULTISPECIES: hypothetical protein [Nostocales]|jgi:hypothetical protein|uniref:Uncharacterized protein n=1 Tax=Dolichospermum flos-aquae UHCC 0037 TaxID=2590026 RepID=A0ACC7S5F3_DOLFA|nr:MULTISPECIES: hypothetical protein [Nostocales]MBO1064583.1 hypothetical protein [Anabaena sp. 54]MCX5984851.1 hypothetical protein [Nostocales cyanobacterium LacPavin_0920_SED1_MAG_38_18]MTJ43452.1 hypothetical protein [Dolichospermum flos-aquae UHCC 0037]
MQNLITDDQVALLGAIQSMGGVFAAIGTPAVSPKPRGKSPGWPTGRIRLRRIRYPTVKNTTPRPKKEQPKSA